MEKRLMMVLQGRRDLMELKQIYLQILVNGLGNSNTLLARLLDNLSVFKSLDCAIQIFRTSQSPNLVAHNAMIRCFIQNGCEIEAFKSYKLMRVLGNSPNHITFTLLLNACRPLLSLRSCQEIHAQLVKFGFVPMLFVQNVLLSVYSCCSTNSGFSRHVFDEMLERDVVSWNSMISAYMNHKDLKQVSELFNLMPERNVVSWNSVVTALSKVGNMALARSFFDKMETRNTISWNAMVTGYVGVGDVESARSIFEQRWDKDVVSWTAMISGYANAGDMQSARKLFDMMPIKNVVSWTTIISGYTKNSQFDEALTLFHLMLMDGKCLPNEPTLISILSAIAHLGSLERGIWINAYIEKTNLPQSINLGNALIDMFAKCGQIENSQLVFNQMRSRCIITWTTMISGLAFNGKCIEAVALFDQFCGEGVEPDDVIFIAALSACTHGGLVEKGQKIFNLMVGQFGIQPRMEHYGCMVDLLGRAGMFKEVVGFIRMMPIDPNIVIWATLLSSCLSHGALDMVESVKKKLQNFESLDPGYQVLLSNSSARTGGWSHAMDVRAGMWKIGLEKVPGCSLIQVDGEDHEFLVKDTKHRMVKEIYDTLDGLAYHMRQIEPMPSNNFSFF